MKKTFFALLIIFMLSVVSVSYSDQLPPEGSSPMNDAQNVINSNTGCSAFDSSPTCYQPLSPITDPTTNQTVSTTDFPTYLQAIYRIGIGVCFVLGVIMFTWAGIEYIVSEVMNTKADAKKRMSAALIGLAIALVSYILLQTLNPDLLIFQDINISATQ